MHAADTCVTGDRIRWTKRPLLPATVYAAAVVVLYRWTDGQWIILPWSLLTMLGLTLAVSGGFKAARGHARAADARRVWASIAAASRSWALLVRSALPDDAAAQKLVHRHLAWLAALRHQVRPDDGREVAGRGMEYDLGCQAPGQMAILRRELGRHVDAHERSCILAADNMAGQVLQLQGDALKVLLAEDRLHAATFLELHRLLHELQRRQAAAERLRDDTAAGRHAIVDVLLPVAFGLLLPFGLLDAMGPLVLFDDDVIGAIACWAIVPLSALLSWLYLTLGDMGRNAAYWTGDDADGTSIATACRALERELEIAPGVAATSTPPSQQTPLAP